MPTYGHDCDPLCGDCVKQALSWHAGVAQCRGESWARSVADVIPVDRPWPDTERMRAIARRKIADLARDARLVELLADEVIVGAARYWDRELAARRAG